MRGGEGVRFGDASYLVLRSPYGGSRLLGGEVDFRSRHPSLFAQRPLHPVRARPARHTPYRKVQAGTVRATGWARVTDVLGGHLSHGTTSLDHLKRWAPEVNTFGSISTISVPRQ